MGTYRNFCILLSVVATALFFTSAPCSAKQIFPYGEPKAKKTIDNQVPLDRAEKIAQKQAREVWGKVSPGPYLEACDDDGDIVAYYFTFSRGTDAFPEYADILEKIKYGRNVAQDGLKAMNKEDQEKIKAKEKGEMEDLESANGEVVLDQFNGQPVKKPLRNAETLARIKGKLSQIFIRPADILNSKVYGQSNGPFRQIIQESRAEIRYYYFTVSR